MSTTRPAPRPALVALLVVGLGLVLAPILTGMLGKAPQGAAMLADFGPLMTVERLDGFQQDLAYVDAAIAEVDDVAPRHVDLAEVSPSYVALSDRWPEIDDTMTTLLDDVQAHRDGYVAMAALPDFRLLPWFFLVPGAVVAGTAGVALRRGGARVGFVVASVAGVGLALVPVVTQMFERAPQGAAMMATFETIQTTENVRSIQGYFATMASGQGGLRLEVLPALEAAGVDVGADLPAAATLERQWVHVLNDMTPMIGAMSDHVASYQAVASMPSFTLFPWFFLAPGLVLLGLAVVGLRPVRAASPTPEGAPA